MSSPPPPRRQRRPGRGGSINLPPAKQPKFIQIAPGQAAVPGQAGGASGSLAPITAAEDRNNLDMYMVHIHTACLHRYVPSDLINDIELSDPQLGLGDYAPTIIVLHPRWCPRCLLSRTVKLQQTMAARVKNLFWFARRNSQTDASIAALRRQVAYTTGLFNGRVAALSTPLPAYPTLAFTNAQGEDMDLSTVLEGLIVTEGERQPSALMQGDMDPIADGDQLSGQLKLLSLVEDEITRDFKLEWANLENESKGCMDGGRLQATAERAAMLVVGARERKESLENALL